MNDEIRQLYEEVILDHNKNPRNFKKVPEETNHRASGDNPLCGDQYSIYLTVKDDVIQDVGFDGAGCAISKASTSLMLERVKGKNVAEAEKLFHQIHQLLTDDSKPHDHEIDLGKLEVLSGVKEFPMRVKCATLSWHIMNAALQGNQEAISTE